MAKIVFRLAHVPEQEADLVRALLEDNHIEYYETDAGRWSISVGALWVKHDDDHAKAREIINEFQAKYSEDMRAQYQQDLEAGRTPNFWQILRTSPFMFITYWALIIAVLAISILPIYHFFNK